jgi:hypothetical protein
MTRPTTRAARAERKGKPSGRQPFVPTPEQRKLVELYTAFGTPQAQIRLHILNEKGRPISAQLLNRTFRLEIRRGLSSATAKMAGKLFSMGMGGNVVACIFWLKTRGGWKENLGRIEQTGPDGAPLIPAAQPLPPIHVSKKTLREVMREIEDEC